MNFKGLKVLVIGTGISGIGAAKLLENVGAYPILFDSNCDVDKKSIEDKFHRDTKVSFYYGELPENVSRSTDLVVLSPGVPTDIPMVNGFRERHIKIWGEIELAYEFSRGDVLAITGTNGKTTTTTLLGEIMKNYVSASDGKQKVFVVGNIGNPYTQAALDTEDNSITVAEISSFQLETIDRFKPKVAAILNITPDHMNRHYTMENYVAIKEKISKNQGGSETVILNYDDPYTKKFGEETAAKVVYFTRGTDFALNGSANVDFVHMNGDMIMYNDIEIINVNDMILIGTHNYENVMAAIGMAVSYGVPYDVITDTVRNFKAVEHRIEFVKTVDGVDYYNDSKGTNPDAAIKGIQAMTKKTVLIGGGYDKKSSYDDWIESFDGKVRYLILLGQTAENIAECARKHGFNDIIIASDLKEAVITAHEKAMQGDAVLLSPACASWGMFSNYEERGRMFKDYVREL